MSVVLEEDDGESRRLARLGPGAWLGELAMLTGAVSSTTVLADGEVRALAIRQADFFAAAEEDPTIFHQLAQTLAQRLRSTDHLFGHAQERRVVLLWHKPAQRDFVREVLDECVRWATSAVVLLSDMYPATQMPADFVERPELFGTLENRLTAGTSVAIACGSPANLALAKFLRQAKRTAALIVIATSKPVPAGVMSHIDETVSLETSSRRSSVKNLVVDVPHDTWTVGPGFDAARIARRICRQQIGLALGGGASRGFAHLGVLNVLLRNGVPIDLIAGTSIGAAIAANIAAGDDLDEIAAAIEINGKAAMLPQLVPAHSIFTNYLLENALRRRYGKDRFEDLSLPLGVTAVDLETGEELVFTSGELVPALLSSMAVPGIFPPVRHNGRMLIDGGLRIPVPVEPCYEMGADIVIASSMRVDADASDTHDGPANLPLLADSFAQALEIMQERLGAQTSERASVRIETAIPRRYAGLFDFRHRALVEAAGEATAEALLPQIIERIAGLRRTATDRAALRAA